MKKEFMKKLNESDKGDMKGEMKKKMGMSRDDMIKKMKDMDKDDLKMKMSDMKDKMMGMDKDRDLRDMKKKMMKGP